MQHVCGMLHDTTESIQLCYTIVKTPNWDQIKTGTALAAALPWLLAAVHQLQQVNLTAVLPISRRKATQLPAPDTVSESASDNYSRQRALEQHTHTLQWRQTNAGIIVAAAVARSVDQAMAGPCINK